MVPHFQEFYRDKTWTGKISYVANYQTRVKQVPAGRWNTRKRWSQSPITVDEVENSNKAFLSILKSKSSTQHPLVPVTVSWPMGIRVMDSRRRVRLEKVKVTLGNADAENQNLVSNLKKDAQVIVNPIMEDGKRSI